MPKLYMLVGLPASGKSTWVENQKFDSKVCIVSTDKHIENYAKTLGKTYNEVFAEYYNIAKKLMDVEIASAVNDQKHIVWDQTNTSKASRVLKLKQIPDNYLKIALVFELPPEKEHNRRLKSREGKIIPQRIISQMKDGYEAPDLLEGFDLIRCKKCVILKKRF